jgi:uncharacterized LabA/DUF88 family protein
METARFTTFAFVDGAYLRRLADNAQADWVDPQRLAGNVCYHNEVTSMGNLRRNRSELSLYRVAYYDAIPEDETQVSEDLADYWRAVELLPDTHLGFGTVRGTRPKSRRQKGVDTLIAVDMIVGSFDKIFDVAILFAGDADFVPVLREVHRRGVLTVVASDRESTADDLIRSADRFVPIGPRIIDWFPSLRVGDRVWPARPA